MVRVVKHEWHQHDRQYYFDFDEDILSEIYPDYDEDAIAGLLEQIENGEVDIEDVINDAWENNIDIDWDFGYDDCWTDRKGGYDVTYEVDNDYEGETTPEALPKTHKCTKCRWEGRSYETTTQWLREDGTVIEDYYASDEDSDITKDICPMCDSDVILTEAGLEEEREKEERMARWAKEAADEEEPVPCFSCGEKYLESSELVDLGGQYHCPSCGEGWVMNDMREDDEEEYDTAQALEELKREFENLLASEEEPDHSADFSCVQCDWKGKIDETVEDKNNECVCPKCGSPIEAEAWPFDDEENKNVK